MQTDAMLDGKPVIIGVNVYKTLSRPRIYSAPGEPFPNRADFRAPCGAGSLWAQYGGGIR